MWGKTIILGALKQLSGEKSLKTAAASKAD
jgi:hypothetical protein